MYVIELAGWYVCLALSLAMACAKWMPADRLPALRLPRGLEPLAVGGAVLLSLLSLILSSLGIAASFGVPPFGMFLQMLYGTQQGMGWLAVLLSAVVWYGADAAVPTPARRIPQLAASAGLIVGSAVTMHAAGLSMIAFLAQAAHLLAVSFWLGFLFLAGWLARAESPWRSFLAWFTPAAAFCAALVIATGIVLMNAFSDDWFDSLALNYGQVLLLKHLLIIPLLAIASINGFLVRGRLKSRPNFDPRSWMRAESALALAVFSVTAALSRQAPPHHLRQTLTYTQPSSWFLKIYSGVVTPDIHLTFSATPMAIFFLAAALLFMALTFLCYLRRLSPAVGVLTALLFVLSGYLAVMTGLQ